MRKLLMVAAVALLPLTAQAQLSLGLRAGYMVPFGDWAKDAPLDDVFDGAIPLQIDATYRIMPDLALGPYFSYGFGLVDAGGECDVEDVDCSGRIYRLGLLATFTLRNLIPQADPWVGIGGGYQWVSVDEEGGNGAPEGFRNLKAKLDLHGWEANAQVGADFKIAKGFSVGPYVQYSIGQFLRASVELPVFSVDDGSYQGQVSDSGSIDDKAIHHWVGGGVRGRFDL